MVCWKFSQYFDDFATWFSRENAHFWGFSISSGPKTDISRTFQDRQSRVNFEEPDWGFVGWTIKTLIGRNTQILKLGWNGLEELFSILIDIFSISNVLFNQKMLHSLWCALDLSAFVFSKCHVCQTSCNPEIVLKVGDVWTLTIVEHMDPFEQRHKFRNMQMRLAIDVPEHAKKKTWRVRLVRFLNSFRFWWLLGRTSSSNWIKFNIHSYRSHTTSYIIPTYVAPRLHPREPAKSRPGPAKLPTLCGVERPGDWSHLGTRRSLAGKPRDRDGDDAASWWWSVNKQTVLRFRWVIVFHWSS